MAKLKLTGRYAVGKHQYAIIDDDLFPYFNQWKWKAKPNDSGNIYAVRNITIKNQNHTLRLHREILDVPQGFDMDVSNITANKLDVRRCNLKITSRKETINKIQNIDYTFTCLWCAKVVTLSIPPSNKNTILYCSKKCVAELNNFKKRIKYRSINTGRPKAMRPLYVKYCELCNNLFITIWKNKITCTPRCKQRGKRSRRKSKVLSGHNEA